MAAHRRYAKAEKTLGSGFGIFGRVQGFIYTLTDVLNELTLQLSSTSAGIGRQNQAAPMLGLRLLHAMSK